MAIKPTNLAEVLATQPQTARAPDEQIMLPRKTNTVPSQKIPSIVSKMEIRRFDLADLAPLGNWLFDRLKEMHPHLNEISFPQWVRQWIASNECLFIRNDTAVALAEICRDSMKDRPWVREVFLYTVNEDDEDGLALYDRIKDWAEQLNAHRLIIGEDTDIAMDVIKDHFKGVKNRPLHYINLGA